MPDVATIKSGILSFIINNTPHFFVLEFNMIIKLLRFFRHPLHTHYTITACTSPRLMEHGFTPGTKVVLIDMRFFAKIFKIRGTMVAIRNTDMEHLTLEEIKDN